MMHGELHQGLYSRKLTSVHRALTRFLGTHGYQGTITDVRAGGTDDIIEHAWNEEGLPIDLKFASDTINVLPPVLRITIANEQKLFLTPAHPTYLSRFNLLKEAAETYLDFGLVLSIFWLWLQSWGLRQYSPAACSFTVLYFFKVCKFHICIIITLNAIQAKKRVRATTYSTIHEW